jgi:predicted PurR-regulated permease PerM
VIGSTIGGAIVTLVALTVSLPVAIGTLVFYIGYRLAEDYLIVLRVMGRTVEVPALVSMVAVLVGAVLLGIVGALIAIPVAAAIRVLLTEITFRRGSSWPVSSAWRYGGFLRPPSVHRPVAARRQVPGSRRWAARSSTGLSRTAR